MRLDHIFLLGAMLSGQIVQAQNPPTFTFRPIVDPSTIIGGYPVGSADTIYRVALNSAGDAAFVTCCSVNTGILTAHRIVAKKGDFIGGKYIAMIPLDAVVEINSAGRVAYEAWYGDTAEIAKGDASGLGIFLEDRLIAKETFGSSGRTTFKLTDGNKVVIRKPKETKPTLDDYGRPIAPIQSPGHSTSEPPSFAVNQSGQIAIPINFETGGFILLLGTPHP